MGKTIEYTITFDSNGNAVLTGLTGASDKLGKSVGKTTNIVDKFGAKWLKLDAIKSAIQGVVSTFDELSAPGMKLSTNMADLSAITGVTGAKLKEIEGYARDSAKAFGGSAADSVESYKLLLSQLTPEIAKNPAALNAMGKSVMTLSKTMGGDVAAATEVLTTSMNQFQVSTDDPIQASKIMADMMNVMAAAAKEGSAELPQIKEALQNAGMAAKMANVSFAETNAAIQVLDKSGKKGAEGGVALRNVLATLSEGRFLPPETQKALKTAGVDIAALGNQGLTLSQRLNILKPILDDSALVTKLFGKENQNAAMALISQTGLMDKYTQAIQGTNTAYDQAATVMDTPAEKMKRMQAKVDDLKLSFFNLTGNAYPFISIGGQIIGVLAGLAPILMVMPSLTSLWTGAQWLLNAAFIASPIGWIVLGIGALIAVIVIAWNKFAAFRAAILTVWDVVKGFGNILKTFIIDRIKGIISGVGSIGSAIYKLFTGDFKGAWKDAKQGALDLSGYNAAANAISAGKKVLGAVGDQYNSHLATERAKDAAKVTADPSGIQNPNIPGVAPVPGAPPTGGGNGKGVTDAIAAGGTRNTTVTIQVGKFAENIVFDGSLKEKRSDLQRELTQIMMQILGMAQSTMG